MYELSRVSGKLTLPVSLDEARRSLRIEDGSHDVHLLEYCIPAAVEVVEARTGRALVTSIWKLSLSTGFPSDSEPIRLPLGQFQSLVSVEYLQNTGDTIYDLDASTVRVRYAPDRTQLLAPYSTGWPTGTSTIEQVDVTWVCGWPVGSLPVSLKHAVLLMTAHVFENPEPVITGTSKELEFTLSALCNHWRLGDDYDYYAYRTA